MRQYIIYREFDALLAREAKFPLTFSEEEDGARLVATLGARSADDALDGYARIFCATQK